VAGSGVAVVLNGTTSMLAVAVLPVPPLVELTGPAKLVKDPSMVPVTKSSTEQLSLAATVPPAKLACGPVIKAQNFVPKDRLANQALSCVYYENEPGQRSAAKLLSEDQARRIAANIASCRNCWESPETVEERSDGLSV
jgi:hypothetical protein